MMSFARGTAVAAAGLAWLIAVPAAAQENIDQGKTPAQLYASDCAICHKSPRGLSKAGGIYGLQGFLREHYTASREAAAAIAAYVTALDRQAPPPKQARNKRPSKAGDKSSKDNKDDIGPKATEQKTPKDSKAAEKSSASEASEAKPKEAAPADAAKDKPVEAEAGGSKPPATPETRPDKKSD